MRTWEYFKRAADTCRVNEHWDSIDALDAFEETAVLLPRREQGP